MFKLGIVGCGGMGNHHANIFSQMEDIKIVACCDLIRGKAETLAAKFDAKVCTDFHDLLDDVDAIVDAVTPPSRPQVVIDTAKAGKHLFSEKPLALNIDAANNMVAAVEKAGVKFMTDYVLRFTNPYRLVHDIFATGELGRIINVWTRRYFSTDMRPLWYGDDALSGGIAMDFQSHDVDQLIWFGGRPKTVFAHSDRVREGVKADEHSQIMLLFQEGMGISDVSWWSLVSTSTFGVVGSKGSIIADGSGRLRKRVEGGTEVELDSNASMSVDLQGNVGKQEEGKIVVATPKNETIQEHFARCLRDNLKPAITIQEARQVLQVVLAGKESSRTGKSVDLG